MVEYTNKPINKMQLDETILGFYLLKSATQKKTAAGKPFLQCALGDATGAINAIIWDYTGDVHNSVGEVVKVQGRISAFRGDKQMIIEKIRLKTSGDETAVTEKDLVPTAPIDVTAAMKELTDVIDSLDVDYGDLCYAMLHMQHPDTFTTIPAAVKVHHSFQSGLLMHTLNMVRAANLMSKTYPWLNRSLLITGTLLHDICKDREFELSGSIATGYTKEGKMLGHLVLGAMDVARVAATLNFPQDKLLLIQHMILSHHGEPEMGAAVKPLFAEAELLHYLDMIDSKLEIYRTAYENMERDSFSETRISPLDNKQIYKA